MSKTVCLHRHASIVIILIFVGRNQRAWSRYIQTWSTIAPRFVVCASRSALRSLAERPCVGSHIGMALDSHVPVRVFMKLSRKGLIALHYAPCVTVEREFER